MRRATSEKFSWRCSGEARRTCTGGDREAYCKREWEDEYQHWQKRDLSARYVYLRAGRQELVVFQTGMRESSQSWKELLVDLKARGLSAAPELAIGDGALGFWRAIEEAFPSTRHQ